MKLSVKGTVTVDEFLDLVKEKIPYHSKNDGKELYLQNPNLYVSFSDGEMTLDLYDKFGEILTKIVSVDKNEKEKIDGVLVPFLRKNDLELLDFYEEKLRKLSKEMFDKLRFKGYYRFRSGNEWRYEGVYSLKPLFDEGIPLKTELGFPFVDKKNITKLDFSIESSEIVLCIDENGYFIECVDFERMASENGIRFFNFSEMKPNYVASSYDIFLGEKTFLASRGTRIDFKQLTERELSEFLVGYTSLGSGIFEVYDIAAILKSEGLRTFTEVEFFEKKETELFVETSLRRIRKYWMNDITMKKVGFRPKDKWSNVYELSAPLEMLYPVMKKDDIMNDHFILSLADISSFVAVLKLKVDEIQRIRPIGVYDHHHFVFEKSNFSDEQLNKLYISLDKKRERQEEEMEMAKAIDEEGLGY